MEPSREAWLRQQLFELHLPWVMCMRCDASTSEIFGVSRRSTDRRSRAARTRTAGWGRCRSSSRRTFETWDRMCKLYGWSQSFVASERR